MDFGDLLGNAFRYTADGLAGRPVTWIVLVILSQLYLIPYIGFVMFMIAAGIGAATLMSQLPLLACGLAALFILVLLFSAFYQGFMVQVMHGDPVPPDFPDIRVLFSDGIRYTVVHLLYFIIPALLLLCSIAAPLLPIMNAGYGTDYPALEQMMGTMLAGLALAILSALILSVFWVTGVVRLARTGSISEAFNFGAIRATIGRTGWTFYLAALVILAVPLFVFNLVMFFIQTIFGIIPVIGFIVVLLMVFIQIVLGPFIAVFLHRYFSLLYDCAETA